MYHSSKSSELISSKQINQKLQDLSAQLSKDYHQKQVVLVGILNGSYILMADLSRTLWKSGLTDFEIDFMGITSYGKDTESSKNPHITQDLQADIRNRHVLIIEDIVDTGYSLDALQRFLKERQPTSLKTLVLLSKDSRREINVKVDYLGFKVEGWVEGYGLDSAQKNRGRPNIVKIHSD